MIPDAADCTNQPLDYYTWEGLLGDAWIIIPFLMGMFFYRIFDGMSFPLKQAELPAEDEDEDESESEQLTEKKQLRFEEESRTRRRTVSQGSENPCLW